MTRLHEEPGYLASLIHLLELAAIRWQGQEQKVTLTYSGKDGWSVYMGEPLDGLAPLVDFMADGHRPELDEALESFLLPRFCKRPQEIAQPQRELFEPGGEQNGQGATT